MSEKCKECNQPLEYQGWRNYATWAFALWADNEERTYRLTRGMAQAIRHTVAPLNENIKSGLWTRKEGECFLFADALKEWAEESAPDLGASVWADLLSAALSSVDWQEIAEHYLGEE